MIVGEGTWVRPTDLPREVLAEAGACVESSDNLRTAMRRFAKSHIEDVLRRSDGDRRQAAIALGVDLPTLHRKTNELDVDS
jgi:transcriptional regulator with PAS, ATPase and Fis domain